MSDDLKPCPFCDGEFQTWGTVRDGRALGCSKCGVGFVAYHGPPENTAEMRLVAKWNTRTDATKDATIARLREALELALELRPTLYEAWFSSHDNDSSANSARIEAGAIESNIRAALSPIPDPAGGMPVEVK